MWCHLPTGFKRRTALRFVAIIPVFIALFTTLIFPYDSSAAPGINQTLNFQGRLLRSTGGVVPDGYYNIEFKLYEGGTGQAAGNPGGTLAWTETYVNNNGTSGVQIKNGMMSVNLGSKTPFGDSVDWNNDTLWLSMNVAGSAADCTAFNAGTCIADGEMTPMKRLTSTPYAMNAGALQGKKAENFVQLAQGVQEDASTNTPSIAINKTGSGNFLQLQSNGADVLNVTNSGNIEFGSGGDHAIYVGGAAPDTAGHNLTLFAGYGGSGSGSMGGSLFLQGGSAGGDNGEGGSVSITGGVGTGTGKNGSVYIGASDTDSVQIGSINQASGTQTINIGNNSGAGTTNVTIGSTGSAGGGSTRIQSKDNTTIATNGVDRATFDTNGNLTLGNGVSSNTPSDFRIQGTASSASGVSGGDLTIQGGGATTGNANGGDLRLSGGDGSGTGSNGQVIIGSPTYTNSGLYSSATNLTIPTATIDSFGVLNLNAEATNVNFTLPTPSRGAGAAGRVIYVTAANGSEDFMLRANVGGGAGVEQTIPMKQNTTMTMIWGGSLWTVAGGAGPASLQSAYDNTVQSPSEPELIVSNTDSTNGLTIRDSTTNPVGDKLLEVQTSPGSSLFSVNNNNQVEYAQNGGGETASGSVTTFSSDDWGGTGSAVVTRQNVTGNYVASGSASVKIVSNTASTGAYNSLSTALEPNTTYNLVFTTRLESGSFTDLGVIYSADGVAISGLCADSVIVPLDRWKEVSCTFTTPASGITANNTIAFGQTGSDTHTYYVDNLSVTRADTTAPNVQVGGGSKGGATTLLTLDSASSAPLSGTNEDLLGSLYYDTTLGKIQCYEADGWGSCGASPDNIVSMTPEYSGAVMHGTGVGAMTADFCSDDLAINADICDTGDTFNYYQWTSPQTTAQEYGIYVTYKLPNTFQSFNPGSTALHGLTDDTDSSVAYEVYRSDHRGLTQCGTEVAVSTGTQTNWQTGIASGSADPSTCDFEAGDSLVVKIIVESRNNANAYVGNLDFAFSNQ